MFNLDRIITKVPALLLIIAFFWALGVGIGPDGIYSNGGGIIKEATSTSNCIENVAQCMKNPPSNPWD